jgi:hypothetical protein
MKDNSNSSRMDIYVENIQKGKHGSDTGAYDAQGRHASMLMPSNSNELDSSKMQITRAGV